MDKLPDNTYDWIIKRSTIYDLVEEWYSAKIKLDDWALCSPSNEHLTDDEYWAQWYCLKYLVDYNAETLFLAMKEIKESKS